MTENQEEVSLNGMTRLVGRLLRGDVSLMLSALSILIGIAALYVTPREEEPQIVVPMADVQIEAPGLTAAEVERQVTDRVEKLLSQIDGVEYVYSMSTAERSLVTVRFYVGENREDSIVKLHSKLQSANDDIPPAVTRWTVKPREIDDVPMLTLALFSVTPDRYADFELRRIAAELQKELQAIPDTNRVEIVSGRLRRIQVQLDPAKLTAFGTSPDEIATAIRTSNRWMTNGEFDQQDQRFVVETGESLKTIRDLQELVIRVVDGRPVYLKNIALIEDEPAPASSYSWIGFGPADTQFGQGSEVYPAVHLAIAKRKGANAVRIATDVEKKVELLAQRFLPKGVHYRITRDYGETANDKVNELVEGLMIAVLTVIVLIGMVIGWRAALVVAIAIPVCYGLTLAVNWWAGYTINRVTLFALILSLGLLVDDPITDVENIARYFATKRLSPRLTVLKAVQEVRPALIMSTLAIIASFLPLAFITGMMGPYMAPMALNVPLTVTLSTLVAFTITPWLAMVALQNKHPGKQPKDRLATEDHEGAPQGWVAEVSRAFFGWALRSRMRVIIILGLVVGALVVVSLLPAMRLIPVKILPYDNKNEFQVVIDMPEGTTLERTDVVARRLGRALSGINEVLDYQVYVGIASPMDFNGLVRHYFLRNESHHAEIRINLVDKERRSQQSHEIILRIRDDLEALGGELGAELKIVEVPPGPPVLATITAEVYGPADASYGSLLDAARIVETRLRKEPGVVDVDSVIQADQPVWRFVVDKQKAALSGISTQIIAETLQASIRGLPVSLLSDANEIEPLWIELRLPRIDRSSLSDLKQLTVRGEQGQLVQLGSLGEFVQRVQDKTIYHKNLQRVAFVYADIAGIPPANVIADVIYDYQRQSNAGSVIRPVSGESENNLPRSIRERTWFRPGGNVPWGLSDGYQVVWTGEGEWKITLDVFRDLGLAFVAALVCIFFLLMFETGSRMMPLLIMSAIPLTLIGILPGFWLLNSISTREVGGYENPVFFTATAMIGVIALSGIVVRNSVVLLNFIETALAEGRALQDAVWQSVAVRLRPIFLTAGTTLLANWVITLDPVFSGLAWAIIFGIFASTAFTLIVVPLAYWLLAKTKPGL
jgi:multidrug efflux pump subunit AcrB